MNTEELRLAARAAADGLTEAELHGTVCGIVCGRYRYLLASGEAGLEELGGVFGLDEYLALVGEDAVTNAETLQDFVVLTLAELDSDDMRFMPLLAESHEPIDRQIESLAEWTAAFLAGLGGAPQTELDDEEAEILEDFTAISSADPEVEDEAEAERLLAELEEYVKVGVLLLMRPVRDNDL